MSPSQYPLPFGLTSSPPEATMTNMEMAIIPRNNMTAAVPNMTGSPMVEPVTAAAFVAAACAAFFASFLVAVFPTLLAASLKAELPSI